MSKFPEFVDEDILKFLDKHPQLVDRMKTKGYLGYDPFDDSSDEEEEDVDPRTIKDIKERLLYAAQKNHIDIVREILDQRPDLICTQDSDGYSPLHRASYNNHVDVIKELILRGANVRLRTNDGWEPLHSACRWNCPEAATVLLHNGANANSQTNMGLTALHLAASDKNARDLLVLLLSQPCIDPTIKDHIGETAYQIARRCGPFADLFKWTDKTEEA